MPHDRPSNATGTQLVSIPSACCSSQSLPMGYSPLTYTINLRIVINNTIRISSYLGNTKINTDPPVYTTFRNIGNIDTDQQVELPLSVNKIGFASIILQQFRLSRTTYVSDLLPTTDSP
jgi:hypothetical protein